MRTRTYSYPSGNASTDMDKVLFSMWGHVSDKLSVELPDVSKTIESREVMRVFPRHFKLEERYLIALEIESRPIQIVQPIVPLTINWITSGRGE